MSVIWFVYIEVGGNMNTVNMKFIAVTVACVMIFNVLLNVKADIVNAEQYEYDSLGRVTKVIHDDNSVTIYEYDSTGNIVKVTNQDSDKSDIDDNSVPSNNPHSNSNNSGNNGDSGYSNTQGSNNPPELPADSSYSDNSGDASSDSDKGNVDDGSGDSTTGIDKTPSPYDNSVPDESITTVTTEDASKTDSNTVLYGQKYTVGVLIYQVKNASTRIGTVSVVGVKKSKRKRRSYTIPKTVKIKGHKYKVTSIGKKAFSKCKKCRRIKIKSKTIVSIHKTAFKGLKKGLKIKVPKSKYKKYKKMLKKCKGVKKLRIKKSLF